MVGVDNLKDKITVVDDEGNQQIFNVDALFEIGDKSYVLLTANKESVFMRLEGEDLITVTDEKERNDIIESYNSAFEELPDLNKAELRD